MVEDLELKSFLEEAFERALYNRLGVDQGRLDELKDEIKKIEDEIETLSNQKHLSDDQEKQIDELKDKLEGALQELLSQANERANKDNAFGPVSMVKSTSLYKSVSAFT